MKLDLFEFQIFRKVFVYLLLSADQVPVRQQPYIVFNGVFLLFLVFLKIKRENYLHEILSTSPFSLLFVSFTLVIRKTKYATFPVVKRKPEKTFRLAGIPTLTSAIPAQHSDQ